MAVYGVNTGTFGLSAGKWYFEGKYISGAYAQIGITDHVMTHLTADELGGTANSWALQQYSGEGVRNNNSNSSFGANAISANEIVNVALDLTNSRLYFGINGTWMQASSASGGDPTDGTGAISITAVASTENGFYFPACGDYDGAGAGSVWEMNFGGCSAFTISSAVADGNGYGAFEYAPPSGYLAICTKNLGSDGG